MLIQIPGVAHLLPRIEGGATDAATNPTTNNGGHIGTIPDQTHRDGFHSPDGKGWTGLRQCGCRLAQRLQAKVADSVSFLERGCYPLGIQRCPSELVIERRAGTWGIRV